ncbi:hypothetical protein ACQP0U_11985 [Micromonospora sp. CA-269861]|uniref:hypothetical protein n=1 Tax=Micromonospora sp. CA-269861 TaxID=3239968 RepID=UPI003D93B69F
MAVYRNPSRGAGVEQTPTGVSVAIGWTVMIAASLVAATLFSRSEMPGRVLIVAVAAGVFAAMVPDLCAVVAVTGLAVATFVGFLANEFGELSGGGGAWSYAVVIGFASTLGIGYRFMWQVPQARNEDSDLPSVVVDRSLSGGRDAAVASPDSALGNVGRVAGSQPEGHAGSVLRHPSS